MCSQTGFSVSRPRSALLILAALTHKSAQRKTEGKLHWQNTSLPAVDGGLMVTEVGFQQMLKEDSLFFLNEEREGVTFGIFVIFDQLREDSRVFYHSCVSVCVWNF